MRSELSCVLIALNEERVIGKMVDALLATYDAELLELLVVDDASTDGTAREVQLWAQRDPRVRLVSRRPPSGVGRALRAGFAEVSPTAKYILSLDADFIESVGDVRKLLDVVEGAGFDGAIGSRFVPGSELVDYLPFKKLMNRSFHHVVRRLCSVQQLDLTNNFKLFRREVLDGLPWVSDDYAMNAETGLWPILAGYRIAEVPVRWAGRGPTMGTSKFSVLKHGPSYLKVLARALWFRQSRVRPASVNGSR